VGGERNFPGLGVIKKNLDDDHGIDFPIFSTLDDLIWAAVELAKKRYLK